MPLPTQLQTDFAAAFVANGGNATEAAKTAGYSEVSARQIGSGLLSKPHVLEAIQEEVRKVIGSDLTAMSVGAIRTILAAPSAGDGAVSHKIKLDAAKTVLDRAGHIAPKAEAPREPTDLADLHRMSIAELEAFIEREKHRAAERAHPVIEGTTVPEPHMPATNNNKLV